MARKKPRKRSRARPEREREKDLNEIIEERMEHFAEEISNIGKYWEKRGKEWESRYKGSEWRHQKEHRPRRPFGIVGPFISSIVGIIFLALILWVIAAVNLYIGSVFLDDIYFFLMENLGLLFLISLFFSYTTYFSKWHKKAYLLFSPVGTAVGVVVALWMIISLINIVNASLWISGLSHIFGIVAIYLNFYLFSIFWLVIIISYLALAVRASSGKLGFDYGYGSEDWSDYMAKKKIKKSSSRRSRPAAQVKRLYRSGVDKILGGVCGGIAEHVNIDPVIVRLLWVLLSLVWGAGILLYIIAWIIIPRNPKHKW